MHHSERPHRVRNFFIGTLLFFVATCLILGGIFLLWASTLTMPTVAAIEAEREGNSTKIYDRTGEVLLYDMHQDVRRTEVPLDAIADNVKHATISIEDARFYHHFGIEPISIIRALLHNLLAGDILGGQGGSTITQQIVKNALLVNDKKISRKLKEWVLAIKLERELSKDQILELYLNEIPYGGTKYGVEEASQGFFGKPAKDLTLTESAYIAALPQAPTYYSPYGAHRDVLDARKNLVLSRMLELGYITKEEHDAARAESVSFRPQTGASIKAPHFVFYVLDELSKTYGDANLAQANLRVITTLDWNLEREAERIVLAHALENSKTYNAHNASLMAVDPKNGDILVMVGSRDYFDESIDGNYNIGLASRQPGSSFKPFAYAAALEKGYTTETVVYDVRTQFSTACDKTNLKTEGDCYAPSNYDNKFRGPMTFREALAQSVNIPAIKALYLAGTHNTIELAKRMGLTTLGDPKRYGLTLVLGGGEVSLLEMTGAYATFAAEGVRYPVHALLEVRDSSGKVLEKSEPKGEKSLERDIALSITDMLADNAARTPAFGANSYLNFPGRDVAVKTGTTNDYRDTWIIGYTPTIAAGAWAGNNDNTAMEKKVAGFIVAPLWNEFMNEYFKQHGDSPSFENPPAIDPTLKPILRGYKYTPPVSDESASSTEGVATPEHDILHYVDTGDPRGPAPANPWSDPQYPYWEYGVLLWRIGNGDAALGDVSVGTSTTITKRPKITIREPDDAEVFRKSSAVRVRFSVTDAEHVVKTEYYLDGTLLVSENGLSTDFSFIPSEYDLDSGDHTLMVLVKDISGIQAGSSVDFRIR